MDDLAEKFEDLQVHHEKIQEHLNAILEVLVKKICG
jgi:hypothetical protein